MRSKQYSDTFGGRLRTLREDNELTQAQLAEALEVSQQGIASWEANRTDPSIRTIRRIAEYFNISVDYLVFNETDQIETNTMNPNIMLHPDKVREIRILQRVALKMNPTQRDKMFNILKLTFDEFNWEE